jgi:ribosomal protein S18 acetylase RimI-like enzyme
MIIRRGEKEDSKVITSYLMLAMGDIVYRFIGENSGEKAISFLEYLVSNQGNQYSYDNCWVAELDNEVVAVALIYDGAKLKELRRPVLEYLSAEYNRTLNIEDESKAGEYYIDCVGVNPNHQGKGIGSKIFKFLIDEYVNKQGVPIGLLVDKNNPLAKKLYIKLGFEYVEDKILLGKPMEHLQLKSLK